MTIISKHIYGGLAALMVLALSLASCTDTISFGSKFLEKAPDGTVTSDTVFGNPEYTRQFLAAIYSKQYYNLPTSSTNNPPQCLNYWKGCPDALGDDYQLFFSNTQVFSAYYAGGMTSTTDDKNNGGIYPYLNEYIWENVRHCWLLIENVDRVPGMEEAEKQCIKDEARCLLAYQYFITFRYYGGLPLVYESFSGSESSYEYPRASVENTVKYIVDLLDEVINGNHLPWGYSTAEAVSEVGHWTLAGAMALKCKVLQFAASPLFNDSQPYYAGRYTMENDSVAWYGGYKPELWQQFRKACDDFFQKLNANGIYHLVQPSGTTQEDYRFAYRSAYLLMDSPEILHSCRVTNSTRTNYNWFSRRENDRFSYSPTEELVEMFPWADGRPFDWDETEREGKLDEMFVKGDTVASEHQLQNRVYTRDPRLYETVGVNGALKTINWGDGHTSGANWEMWVGGTDAGQGPATNTGLYATGYHNLKYIAGDAYDRKHPQWSPLLLSDMYLTYAEAIIKSGGSLSEAIGYIDAVRARVGLKGVVECNPDKNLTSDADALMEVLMNERACELTLQLSRYFDLIRYKRADLFERPLHGLRIYRLKKDASGQWTRSETQWYKTDRNDKSLKPGDPDYYEPSHFDYERFQITTGSRQWWTEGFDPKWYLQPFPLQELNKGYGLIQNAGW